MVFGVIFDASAKTNTLLMTVKKVCHKAKLCQIATNNEHALNSA